MTTALSTAAPVAALVSKYGMLEMREGTIHDVEWDFGGIFKMLTTSIVLQQDKDK